MNPRYQNKNIAVLGAGLSGTAAALLLRSQDANVSVLDSATENKLPESTIKNLRDHGVRVISGPAAETNRDAYDLAVLSPGIDPDSPLAQSFSSRNIEMIGELELGWRSGELPAIAVTGTNGKTTTTYLCKSILEAAGVRVGLIGTVAYVFGEERVAATHTTPGAL